MRVPIPFEWRHLMVSVHATYETTCIWHVLKLIGQVNLFYVKYIARSWLGEPLIGRN